MAGAAVLILLGLFILAFSGVPLFAVMALGALIGFYFIAQVDIAVIIQEAYKLSSAPALIAIPLFTLAGYILAESKAPERLLRLTKAYIGWLPGGVPLVVLVTTSFFTALTGASGITIVALGGLLMPILVKAGYSEKFSLGIVTATGAIGLLLPPSLPIILYGVIAQVPVNELFIAGIIPCIVMIFILFIYAFVVSISGRSKFQKEKFSLREILSSTKAAIFEVPLPLFIIWGIYTGKFTAAETATIAVVWVIIAEIFIYKDIKVRDFPKVAKESMLLVGAIFSILGMAMGFTNFLIDQEVPQKLFEISRKFIESKLTFFIVLNTFLLVVGMLMDIFSAIVVVVPLIVPIAVNYGIDPVHLGIVFLANLEIGYLTPPVGLNLFISSFRFGKPITYIYKLIVPYILLLIVALLIITYVPQFSLKLVRGEIIAEVTDEKGEFIPAKVKVPEAGIEVEGKGKFKFFLPLPDFTKPHRYLFVFEAYGYQTVAQEIKVEARRTEKLRIRMERNRQSGE